VTPVLWRSSLRYLVRHPWLLGLSLLGVALGVAVVIAVDLANESARSAFRLSSEVLTGAATHRIVGGPQGVPEGLYAELRLAGFHDLAPAVEGYLRLPGRTLQLLGIDPLAEAPLRRPGAADNADLEQLLVVPGATLLAQTLATRLGIAPGGSFSGEAGGRTQMLRLVGRLVPPDVLLQRALEGLAVVDIATAQELLGRHGRLSRIDVVAPLQQTGEWLARLREQLPPGVTLETAGGEAAFMTEVTEAFALNLTALSLLALLVGGFLVYNTMSFTVLQRLPLLGILRGLGVSRGELFRLVGAEALLVGAVGSAAGVLLGLLLASGLVHLVTRTVDDLYFTMTVSGLFITPWSLLKGVSLGLGASWLAAVHPARIAARATPGRLLQRSWVEGRAQRGARIGALVGTALVALAWLLPVLDAGLLSGFAALTALLVGAALLVPMGLLGLAALLRRLPWCGRHPVARLAVRSLDASLSRTGVATAALAVAIATTIGIAGMIDSFRLTVDRWLAQRLQADVYISAPGALDSRSSIPLDPAVVMRLKALPGVRATSTYRGVTVSSEHGPAALAVVDLSEAGRAGHLLKEGETQTAWAAFGGGAVLLSEPFAYRTGLGSGTTLRLLTPRGERPFTVAGVYFDYGSGTGHVLMSRATYMAHWDDPVVSSVGLYAVAGITSLQLLESARAALDDAPSLRVRSNAELRSASLAIFDRTFRITEVLRWLAVVIAFVGVLSACMTLQFEQAREHAVLRALGLLPGQLRGLVMLQTALLGAAAGLFALPLGAYLAQLLTTVINRRAFGWTLTYEPTLAPFAEALAIAVGAALLAGWIAARRAAEPPATALRLE